MSQLTNMQRKRTAVFYVFLSVFSFLFVIFFWKAAYDLLIQNRAGVITSALPFIGGSFLFLIITAAFGTLSYCFLKSYGLTVSLEDDTATITMDTETVFVPSDELRILRTTGPMYVHGVKDGACLKIFRIGARPFVCLADTFPPAIDKRRTDPVKPCS